MNKPTIGQTAEIMKLRGLLQEISHISMTYSLLNKNFPIFQLNDRQAIEIIKTYKELLQKAKLFLDTYSHGESDTTT